MNKRERMLAAGVCVIVALWAGKSLFTKYRTAVDAHRKEVLDFQSRLSDAKFELEKGKTAVRQMEHMQERSLPADREKALSLYKTWLLTKAKAAGLMVNDIKLAPRTTASTAFEAIGYQMEATGTLTQLASMLYEFYHSPQLHQITRLRLLRPPGSPQLQITLEVEALCLSSAVATDALPEGDSKRLKLASAAEYQKNLGERDMATVYTPPRPPGPPPSEHHEPAAPPKFDDSEYAHFTATTGDANGLQAWINVWTTGESMHLNAGDPVKVGALEGTIESIEARSLVLKTGDKKYRIPLGESLRKGKELDASGNVKPEKQDEPDKKS